MALHYDSMRDRSNGAQFLPTTLNSADNAGNDELTAEADEPPDNICFSRRPSYEPGNMNSEAHFTKSLLPKSDQKPSLLTQAILSSPDMLPADVVDHHSTRVRSRDPSNASMWSNTSLSVTSTAELTSDELTSPARTGTPSPPLPPIRSTELPTLDHKHFVISSPDFEHAVGNEAHYISSVKRETTVTQNDQSEETKVEAGLGRKRCITFACGRRMNKTTEDSRIPSGQSNQDSNIGLDNAVKLGQPAKRPCMLKFVCPSRESREQVTARSDKDDKKSHGRMRSPPPPSKMRSTPSQTRVHRDSESTIKNLSPRSVSQSPVAVRARRLSVASEDGLDQSEATAFHEFASSVQRDDEWLMESITHKEKITVNDTLKKENAIRQLGQEAEEEALQEDEEDDELAQEEDEIDEDEDENDEEYLSDGGNETDDEEGFADSDDESDAGSDYQFWTPGKTTAATSVDALEHIRPSTQRAPSDSSVGSTSPLTQSRTATDPVHHSRKRTQPIRMRPGTPDLPDSTDFVPGTLDEDRPLEEAYASCIAQRKNLNHVVLPQDIDPSFPTSDPEDEDEEEEEAAVQESDDQLWIKGQLDDFEDGARKTRRGRNGAKRTSPSHSPKRLRSPAPKQRGHAARSPPPRRQPGISPPRVRSPLPAQHLRSMVETSSAASSLQQGQARSIKITPLAKPAPLTHTKSLPRTPNPLIRRFATQDDGILTRNPVMRHIANEEPGSRSGHSRGAIDIVKGLERKRQRRKEKLYWQKHARQAAKDKDRKTQPGKGAERMRELGLEIAGRGKITGGFWQKEPQYVLSL